MIGLLASAAGLVAAGLVAAVCILMTGIAVRATIRARERLQETRAELVTLLERLAAADAVEERLRQQIADQVQRREADFETFRVQVQDLRENYERVIHQYQLTYGIHGPAVSRRVQ